jgi:hypothetical protein
MKNEWMIRIFFAAQAIIMAWLIYLVATSDRRQEESFINGFNAGFQFGVEVVEEDGLEAAKNVVAF